MARRRHKFVYGDKELELFWRKFPKSIKGKVVKQAANVPSWLIANKARANLRTSPAFKNIGTKGGYSKLLEVMGKIEPYKGSKMKFGVAIQPKFRGAGTDLQVPGSKRPNWTIWGWANLLAVGRGGGKERGGKTRARYRNTGTTRGAGDYIKEAAQSPTGHRALSMMTKNLRVFLDKRAKSLNTQLGKGRLIRRR